MGFFSWKTQDTDRSIANKYSNMGTFTVYMINPLTGASYKEDNYDGYGVFGGKDFYELLAEINGKTDRADGIDLAFSTNKSVLSPILVEHLEEWEKYKGSTPENCEYQGYFYDDEEEEEEC